jgi:hypothetical protein
VHPAAGRVPGWRAEHDAETRDSGAGGALPASLPLKNRVLPANASPAPSLPRFLSFSLRSSLAPLDRNAYKVEEGPGRVG